MSTSNDHKLPEGATSTHTIELGGKRLDYIARADWIPIRRREKTIAEMFHVAYVLADSDPTERPITFVFNGGPGAASAYLHMGAVGPKRAVFNDDGTPPAPPARIEDNNESWLAFSDLVFIDPIGTGFSRAVDEESAAGSGGGERNDPDDGDRREARAAGHGGYEEARAIRDLVGGSGGDAGGDRPAKSGKKPEEEFFGLKRDLESLCEFIRSFLSRHGRWRSPAFIAGESYGGYRVGKLARLLQERYGVGLNGALLISPALEFHTLDRSDYDVLPWIDALPSYSLAATVHGKQSAVEISGTPHSEAAVASVREAAERFAARDLPALLTLGDTLPERERGRVYARLARLTGLPREFVARKAGRIGIRAFARELLRESRRVLGLYDASVGIIDPYPDREQYEGPDATLMAIDRVFSAGINTQLRENIGLKSERDYHLLSFDVNKAWKVDYERHALESHIGATDDLRYGIQLNPHMHVRISHGIYDLVTPYYASERLAANMKLDDAARARVSLRHYPGGHMFYTWQQSRAAFTRDVAAFYRAATGGG